MPIHLKIIGKFDNLESFLSYVFAVRYSAWQQQPSTLLGLTLGDVEEGVEQYTVKDVMVPLSEYATVPEGSTLFEAVMALERAQEDFDHTKYRHRGILVLDQNNEVIGKINQVDVLRALEPEDIDLSEVKELNKFSFSPKFVRNLYKQRRLQGAPMQKLCMSAGKLKVEACMQNFVEGEYIDQDTSLDVAIQHLVLGNLLSLLVTHNKKIVGILRLSDVFAAVFHAMKECENKL